MKAGSINSTVVASRKHKVFAEDKFSCYSHFLGAVLSFFATILMVDKVGFYGTGIKMFSVFVFGISLVLLYSASALYHYISADSPYKTMAQKFDHMMIYVLIAGSYTPITLLSFPLSKGVPIFKTVWIVALIGIFITLLWVKSPKWLNSLIYISMGWVIIFNIKNVTTYLSAGAFALLLAGGIIYTVGGIIYALKIKALENRFPGFGAHELFHLFVMAGSLCHIVMVYFYLI
ncbi:MAG: hemolysin III family protein [Lachnospiraceae bacterium]|nr:hemolysin III family protein [Lachnospiraceae bacterium]